MLQRDLSLSVAFYEIAALYRKARQPELALEWAERGLKAFPKDTDQRLRKFLVEEYQRRGRHDEALA